MRDFPKTQAVQDALRVVTDPEFAALGGPGLRRLAWCVLMETRGRIGRQAHVPLFHRPTSGDAA